MSHLPMRSQLSLIALAAFTACAGWSLSACSSTGDALDEREKAKRVQELRKRADDALARFAQSGEDPKGADLDSLLRYVEFEGETTKLLPGTCPSCYQRHAFALARLGLYYRDLSRAFAAEASKAPPSEKKALEAKVQTYRKEMLESFASASRQFESYFRTAAANSQFIDPEAYRWLFRIYEHLEDYSRALYYLDLYTSSVVLTEEGKRNAEELRRAYRSEIRRLEDERLRRELGEGR